MKLFLDDERRVENVYWIDLPSGPWKIVCSYAEFVGWIVKNGMPKHISFDHDLAEEHYPWHPNNVDDYKAGKIDYSKYKEKTGYDAAKWLVEHCRKQKATLPKYTIHTLNKVGKRNIDTVLKEYENRS